VVFDETEPISSRFSRLSRSCVFQITLQVKDFDISPAFPQVFSHETAVTMMRLILTAQQTRAIKFGSVNFLDTPLPHEVEKLSLVCRPRPSFLLQLSQHILGWCQLRQVPVRYSGELGGEPLNVISLGKACELRDIVKSNIGQESGTAAAQPLEKVPSCRFCKANRVNLHSSYTTSGLL
jgi:hypothetical protein